MYFLSPSPLSLDLLKHPRLQRIHNIARHLELWVAGSAELRIGERLTFGFDWLVSGEGDVDGGHGVV